MQLPLSFCVIAGFRSEGDENRALLVYYGAKGGNFLPTLCNLFSLKVGKKLPNFAA
jgi:hypothetical protein